jgi:hypothetical protein
MPHNIRFAFFFLGKRKMPTHIERDRVTTHRLTVFRKNKLHLIYFSSILY